MKYYFFPNVEEFENYPKTEWRQSPWNKTNVSIDPKKTAYVGKIIQWNDMFYSTVKTGFNGKLTGASVQNPTPPVVKSPSVSPSVAERLKKLSALFNQELITKQEYEDKRKEILNSM